MYMYGNYNELICVLHVHVAMNLSYVVYLLFKKKIWSTVNGILHMHTHTYSQEASIGDMPVLNVENP